LLGYFIAAASIIIIFIIIIIIIIMLLLDVCVWSFSWRKSVLFPVGWQWKGTMVLDRIIMPSLAHSLTLHCPSMM